MYIQRDFRNHSHPIDISDLRCLENIPPQIEVLCLHGNPVCELEADVLRMGISKQFPQLRELDGKVVTSSKENT